MSYAATETRAIVMTPYGVVDGPAVFPPSDEWSPDPVAGVAGNSLEDLEAVVAISLFTDIRVEASELPPGEEERRGWWGDTFPDPVGDRWGGRLWLADSAIVSDRTDVAGLVSPETVSRWVEEAIDWMITDGILSSVSVAAERNGLNRIDVEVTMHRLPPEDPTVVRYAFLWGDTDG